MLAGRLNEYITVMSGSNIKNEYGELSDVWTEGKMIPCTVKHINNTSTFIDADNLFFITEFYCRFDPVLNDINIRIKYNNNIYKLISVPELVGRNEGIKLKGRTII
jgi:head-tail adaptor